MNGDLSDGGAGDAAVLGAVEVAGFDRQSVAGREDHAGVVPGVAGLLSGGLLLLVAVRQCGDADGRQREGSIGLFGLGGTGQQLTVCPLERLSMRRLMSQQCSQNVSP